MTILKVDIPEGYVLDLKSRTVLRGGPKSFDEVIAENRLFNANKPPVVDNGVEISSAEFLDKLAPRYGYKIKR